jgi:catechol 2,3-dioxygenase-like lactoylglutathione lyase family enzyme
MRIRAIGFLALGLAYGAAVLFPTAWAQEPVEPAFGLPTKALNVVFSASDAGKVRQFYGVILGLEEIAPLEIPGSGPMLRFMAGKTELKFIILPGLEKRPGGRDAARGIRMLTLFVPDRDAVVERLKANGYPTEQFFDQKGAPMPSGYLRDPDDNELNVVFMDPRVDLESFGRMRIGLTVADAEASRRFYQQVLGLAQNAPIEDGTGVRRYNFQAGHTTIWIWKIAPGLPAPTTSHTQAYGMHYIQFIVSDVEAVHNTLKEKQGVSVVREPFDLGDLARIFMIADPDGTVIEFAGPKK